MKTNSQRLIVVSNRLPFVVGREQGVWRLRPASGGLVTALAPVLQQRGGMWIGWPGRVTEEKVDLANLLDEYGQELGYSMKAVSLTRAERDRFYYGFANEVIWPLFHCLGERCNFNPIYWDTYRRVNRKFAEVVHSALSSGAEDYAWIHDYHLMLVGDELRRQGVRSRLGFFLHTPFPPPDIFLKLPWRSQLLRGLLAYDTIGFQTARDRGNFIQCLRMLLRDCSVRGRGRVQTVTTPWHTSQIGTFPISIDFREFAEQAAELETCAQAAKIRKELPDRKIILGVDRLDYTKGIPARLKAFRRFLRDHPEFHRKVTLVQIVVPSREEIRAYRALKEEIDELVGEINGEYTTTGWVPVHYSFRSLQRPELLAFYRVSAAALVTPLIDGMNLVAKEYCAANVEETGVLILSEFAGAASELERGALLVNPYDLEGVSAALHEALTMSEDERRRRMRKLRQLVRQRDIGRWLNDFLQTSTENPADDPSRGRRFVRTEREPVPREPEPREPLETMAGFGSVASASVSQSDVHPAPKDANRTSPAAPLDSLSGAR